MCLKRKLQAQTRQKKIENGLDVLRNLETTHHSVQLCTSSRASPSANASFGVSSFVAAIAGFCYITSQNIIDLINEPISTSITEQRESELEFPAVTICSLGFLNTTELNRQTSGLSISVIDQLQSLFDNAQEGSPESLSNCQATAQSIIDATGFNDGFSTLITDTARNDPFKLVIECTFQGENCVDDLVPINTISGVCFTFNGPTSGPARTVQGTGVRQGLRLQLRNSDQSFSLNFNYGYNVIIHNRDEPPRPESEGVVVGLTSTLYVSMRQETSIDKTLFYSEKDCIGDSTDTTTNFTFDDYSAYSRSLCLNDCLYSQIADKCNCVERHFYDIPEGSPYSSMPFCNPVHLCCEVSTFENFKDNCDCPLKCDTVRRTFTASSATNAFEDRVGVNVYYETLVSEVRETTDSYTPWSLISDIGGNSGLFLGFTLLTTGEVVLLVLALCTDCCCSSGKARMKKHLPCCWVDGGDDA